MLDETFRGRIHDLADGDQGDLDEAARERIFEHIRQQGPALVRDGRRRRFVLFASGATAVAAAAAAILLLRHPAATQHATGEKQNGAALLACATRKMPSVAPAFTPGAAGERLDLGSTAYAAAMPGAAVHLEEASPCRTIIALDSGTIAVHAKDLGGGELRVRTPRGDVVVHGTIFSVTETPTSLAVEVVVGKVTVTDHEDSHSVTTGQRLLLSAVGAASGPLEPARARSLRAVLGVPDTADETQPVGEPESATPGAVAARSLAPAAPPRVATRGEEPRSPTVATGHAAAPRAEEPSKEPLPVPEVSLETDEATKAPPAAQLPPGDPLAMAEHARRGGDYATARELYRRAGEGTGATAEAAWVALARMELSLGHAAAARQATNRRQERFGRGTLSPEALWIDVRSYRQSGDVGKARALANQLVEGWPSSPQARAAQRWLSSR